MTLINEEWKNSHAKEKLNKILFIYYIYNKENIELSTVKKVSLWELSRDKSEIIIQNDWLKTKEKILDGYAHTLSEKGFHILSPSRSGSGGIDKDGNKKDLVIQPNKLYADKALKRAFSLKQSFTNQLWNEINSLKYESILELLDISSMDEFEVKILKELHKYVGKSIVELSKIFDIEIPNGKNQVATVVKKAIGFKNVNSKIKEFEQLGIIIKTIKVRREDFMPFEAVSFATMKLKEFEREEYDESIFKEYIEKILFVPIFSDGKKLEEKYLAKSFFWSPSEDEEVLIRDEWNRYKSEVLLGGCEVTKVKNNSLRGYREVSKLFKESQTKIIHMRPHGRDSNDRDEDSQGNSIVKQCFWLNKKFLQKLIKQNS
jgi:DNA mismatch repair endonuclease MutH